MRECSSSYLDKAHLFLYASTQQRLLFSLSDLRALELSAVRGGQVHYTHVLWWRHHMIRSS